MEPWNLGNVLRTFEDERQLRAARLAVERGLVRIEGEPPGVRALVERGLLTRAQADALLGEVDTRHWRPFGDRYEIQAKLGEGGMAQVWRAFDRQLGRPVALKFIKGDLCAEETARQRLLREARAVASLSHPNVVTVHDLGEASGRAYIVMELVDGSPLARMLPQRRGDRRGLLALLEKAARGVAAAHDRGIVHRDLKPANVLVGGDGEPKVADFGLARRTEASAKLTATGEILGTASYMAPEQVDSSRGKISTRTDVYALGVMLYEILTGRLPHEGATGLEIFVKILHEEPVPPRTLEATVPRDVEAICLKAIEKESGRRYATARQFADDLRRHLDGRPVLAKPPTPAARIRRFVARRRIPLLAAAGLAAALLATGILVPLWRRSERGRERAELYLPLEKELELLRLKSYVAGFRMTDADYALYQDLARKVREQMGRSGETAQGWHLVGRCQEVLWRRSEAEAAYDRALELDPEHGVSRYQKTRLAIERALSEDDTLDPARKGEARVALARAVESMAGDAMERDLAEAYRLLVESPKQACAFCEGMLAKWEGKPFAEEFLILAGLAAGNKRTLLQRAGEAIARRPSYAWAWYLRGTTHIALDGLDAALSDFDQAIRCNPRDPGPYNNRGVVFVQRGDFKAALAEFERATRVDSRYVVALSNLGYAKEKLGDAGGAVEAYTAALAVDPGRPRIWTNRGVARHHGLRDPDGAIEDFTRAIELDATHWGAWFERGRALFTKGRYDEAERDLTEAARLAPERHEPCFERARVREQKGDRDGMIADLEKALEVAPADWPLRAETLECLKQRKR